MRALLHDGWLIWRSAVAPLSQPSGRSAPTVRDSAGAVPSSSLAGCTWWCSRQRDVVAVGQDIVIEEPPESVWLIISDVERTGDWSPECRRCRWLDGADRPVVGGRYRGSSRNGWRRWSTTSTITSAIPGVELQWDVTYFRRPVARWQFHLTELSDGRTRLEETVEDRREWWLRIVSPWVTGSRHRDVRNASTIGTSLTRIKAIAEAQHGPSSADGREVKSRDEA